MHHAMATKNNTKNTKKTVFKQQKHSTKTPYVCLHEYLEVIDGLAYFPAVNVRSVEELLVTGVKLRI